MRVRETILLAVGPTVTMQRAALAERGIDPLDPRLSIRPISRATQLRGWSHGTPVVAKDISTWGSVGDRAGEELADCLLNQLRIGRFRLLQDHEVEDLRRELA